MMNRFQLLIVISTCAPSKRETRLFNPVDVKFVDPLGDDTEHQELMRDMRGAMWVLRAPSNPSEEAGVDKYLYYWPVPRCSPVLPCSRARSGPVTPRATLQPTLSR
jgi:hypothetical protein